MIGNGTRSYPRKALFHSQRSHLLAFSVLYVIPVVMGGIILWQMFTSQLHSSQEKYLSASLDTFSLILENTIANMESDLSTLAQDNTVQVTMDLVIRPQLRRYLKKQESLGRFTFLDVLDPAGAPMVRLGQKQEGIEANLLYHMDKPLPALVNGRFFIFQRTPITRKGRHLGPGDGRGDQ